MRRTVSGHTTYDGLPRRGFGPHRPYSLVGFLPKYSAAAWPSSARGVVVGMVVMPAGLADERGLRDPVVRADVSTEGAFPQALIRIEADARLTGRDSLITGESDNLTRGGSEDFLT